MCKYIYIYTAREREREGERTPQCSPWLLNVTDYTPCHWKCDLPAMTMMCCSLMLAAFSSRDIHRYLRAGLTAHFAPW